MMINLKLIQAAKEEHAFSGITFMCPECQGIEDEQYCCTLCWLSPQDEISVNMIIETLLQEISTGEEAEKLGLVENAIEADAFSGKYFACPTCEFAEPGPNKTCELCWQEGYGNFFGVEDALLFLVGTIKKQREIKVAT